MPKVLCRMETDYILVVALPRTSADSRVAGPSIDRVMCRGKGAARMGARAEKMAAANRMRRNVIQS